MKSYKNYISEANYTRFLEMNNNLTPEQVKELNDYFSKENRKAGKKIQWQTKKVKNMEYEDFEKIMLSYKSGFIKKMKVIIPGKKGEDYQQVNLKNKRFLAYIPLNWETAIFLNSKKYGTVATGHCIGWPNTAEYWDLHMIDEQKVPIYLIDATGKWVVTIKNDNNRYEVWDKWNKKDSALTNKEPIPGFSIKKELMTSGLKKLYNNIRSGFFGEEDRNEEIEKTIEEIFADVIAALEINGNSVDLSCLYSINSNGAEFLTDFNTNDITDANITIEDDSINIGSGDITGGEYDAHWVEEITFENVIIHDGNFNKIDKFHNCVIKGGTIERSEFDGCKFYKGEMDCCEINNSYIYDSAEFKDSVITNCAIKGSKFDSCKIMTPSTSTSLPIQKGDFDYCKIFGIDINGGEYFDCDIASSSIRDLVEIVGGNFLGCKITRAEIDGEHAKFEDCNFHSSKISNTKLTRSTYDKNTIIGKNVVIDDTPFDPLKFLTGKK